MRIQVCASFAGKRRRIRRQIEAQRVQLRELEHARHVGATAADDSATHQPSTSDQSQPAAQPNITCSSTYRRWRLPRPFALQSVPDETHSDAKHVKQRQQTKRTAAAASDARESPVSPDAVSIFAV